MYAPVCNVCVHTYLYVFTCVSLCVCIVCVCVHRMCSYISVLLHVYVLHMFTGVWVFFTRLFAQYMYVHVCVCVCVCVFAHTCVCV